MSDVTRTSNERYPSCPLTGNQCLTDTWDLSDPPNCSCGRLVRENIQKGDEIDRLRAERDTYHGELIEANKLIDRLRSTIRGKTFVTDDQPDEKDGWRPIDSAPKDGRWIIAAHRGSNQSAVVKWSSGEWVDVDHGIRSPSIWMPVPKPERSAVETSDGGMVPSDDLQACAREVLRLEDKIAALQKFKDFVHSRLDQAGVEKDPPGEHRDAGCRIGQRLDLVLGASLSCATPDEKSALLPGGYCRRCAAQHQRVYCPDCGLKLIPAERRPEETSERSSYVSTGWEGKAPWFKVGDKVLDNGYLWSARPVCTVTEITERGFKYSHARWNLVGSRIGWTEGGETFSPSMYVVAAENGSA